MNIVLEILIRSKNSFITCLYRSPSKNAKIDVDEFVYNLENTMREIERCNPYVSFLIGDFNAKNSNWWGNKNDYQGIKIDQAATEYGYNQIISEATNFEPNCEPSCIDLIFTSEPNLVQNSGTFASLFDRCHHQIVFADVNFKVFYPPKYERKIWDYKNADLAKIQESLLKVN